MTRDSTAETLEAGGVTAKPQSNGTGNCQPVGSELVGGRGGWV